jgi:hypothetical protein
MRKSISLGAGFSKEDRCEHNLRVARLAKVLNAYGHNVVVSVIAPHKSTRAKIDKIIDCMWVYVKRTVKYDDYRPYEPPEGVPVIDNDLYEGQVYKAAEELRYIVAAGMECRQAQEVYDD